MKSKCLDENNHWEIQLDSPNESALHTVQNNHCGTIHFYSSNEVWNCLSSYEEISLMTLFSNGLQVALLQLHWSLTVQSGLSNWAVLGVRERGRKRKRKRGERDQWPIQPPSCRSPRIMRGSTITSGEKTKKNIRGGRNNDKVIVKGGEESMVCGKTSLHLLES